MTVREKYKTDTGPTLKAAIHSCWTACPGGFWVNVITSEHHTPHASRCKLLTWEHSVAEMAGGRARVTVLAGLWVLVSRRMPCLPFFLAFCTGYPRIGISS